MQLLFMSWARFGLNALETSYIARIYNEDGSTTQVTTARRNITVEMELNGGSGPAFPIAGNTFTLMGPGEVVGLDPSAVALTEPLNEESEFPVNHMPYVEFADVDLPWRYTIDEPVNDRLKPWVALIVLNQDEYADATPSEFSRMITVNTDFLPNLRDSWANAHIQATVPRPAPENIAEYIRENPDAAVARLVCTRRLKPLRKYTAFVVPVYEMGLLAARGFEIDESDRLSWTPGGNKDIMLPYYYRFEFSTSEMGDFAELAKRIKVSEDLTSATRTVYDTAGKQMEFQGLVKPFGSADPDRKHNAEFAAAKKSGFDSVCAGISVLNENAEPNLTLPLYGYNYCKNKALRLPDRASGGWDHLRDMPGIWFSEMNFDRGFRYTASLGAAAVRENQDEFVSRCFEIGGDVIYANEYVNRYKALKKIRRAVIKKHVIGKSDIKLLLTTKHLQHFYDGYTGEPSKKYPTIRDPLRSEVRLRPAADIKKGIEQYWARINPRDLLEIVDMFRGVINPGDLRRIVGLIKEVENPVNSITIRDNANQVVRDIIQDIIRISVKSNEGKLFDRFEGFSRRSVREQIASSVASRVSSAPSAPSADTADSPDQPLPVTGAAGSRAADFRTADLRAADLRAADLRAAAVVSARAALTPTRAADLLTAPAAPPETGPTKANVPTVATEPDPTKANAPVAPINDGGHSNLSNALQAAAADPVQAALLLQRASLNLSTLGLLPTAVWAAAGAEPPGPASESVSAKQYIPQGYPGLDPTENVSQGTIPGGLPDSLKSSAENEEQKLVGREVQLPAVSKVQLPTVSELKLTTEREVLFPVLREEKIPAGREVQWLGGTGGASDPGHGDETDTTPIDAYVGEGLGAAQIGYRDNEFLQSLNGIVAGGREAALSMQENTADWYRCALLDTDIMKASLRERIVKTDPSAELPCGAYDDSIGETLFYLSPKLGDGLFNFLPISQLDHIFPGLSGLEDNSTVMLQSNQKFLEAYLLGANMEMVQELIWREFPIHRQATVFNSFWDADEGGAEDVKDIGQWGALGANTAGRATDNIILAIRCDLFRRYANVVPIAVEHAPGMDVTAIVNAVMQGGNQGAVKTYPPMFTNSLFEDLNLLHYSLTASYMQNAKRGANPGGAKAFSFLLMENISYPKFGLAETSGSDTEETWGKYGTDEKSGYLKVTNTNKFPNAAALADVLLNRPCAAILDFDRICS